MAGSFFYLPLERVVFGRPAAEAARDEAARIGARRVFVVSSKTLSRRTPAISDIQQALGERYAGVFDNCIAHTPWPSVIEAADAVRAARPDLILTVGGGTPIDTVKILQLALAHGARAPQDLDRLRSGALKEQRPSPVRQVAVPTTLSGAEFSNLGGGTDPHTRIKHSFSGPDIGARAVILDPALTVYTPEWLWLSTGVRGVDHAVEALCSVDAHPYCDGLALHALRLFAEYLPRSKAAPADLAVRLACQQASWLAASTIARVNYGASHGIGHALGAAAGVPHGHTSCIMLPHVMRYNLPATAAKQQLIAEALGQSGKSAADAVAQLVAALGQPATLRAAGVKREQLPQIAEGAMHSAWVRANPQPITSSADVMRLLEAAY
ncbi:MAG TPA: iron-containing alcohol dehydrogenase [Burkholderiales bacterium]|nr:iron-containing alcohol dehydrogenase [Burkholderiales bacterium]